MGKDSDAEEKTRLMPGLMLKLKESACECEEEDETTLRQKLKQNVGMMYHGCQNDYQTEFFILKTIFSNVTSMLLMLIFSLGFFHDVQTMAPLGT